jgi:hypothetical protein
MDWIVFTYSLPTKLRSSPRVALWRRLKRLGAVSLAGGMQVLPAREECVEAFQWLAQEIRQAKGDALVLRVQKFEGLTAQQIIELFQRAREEEYRAIDTEVKKLEKTLIAQKTKNSTEISEMLGRLRKQHSEIARIDYFDSADGSRVASRIAKLEQSLAPTPSESTKLGSMPLAKYREKRWVTRPRPHVDRLACVWLIRKFINPKAEIRYATQLETDEIAFDIEGAEFGHQGNLCTFETMQRAFKLSDPTLSKMAEIIHEIDLRDGRYTHLEIEGIERVLQGWLQAGFPDEELEAHGLALFEGLYLGLSSRAKTGARNKKKQK